jgi:hypothetical protein
MYYQVDSRNKEVVRYSRALLNKPDNLEKMTKDLRDLLVEDKKKL